jgi:hypothetical protein
VSVCSPVTLILPNGVLMRARLGVLILLATACGKSDEQKAAEAAAAQLEELGKALGGQAAAGVAAAGAASAAMLAGKASDAVDFRELKALMPEEAGGMPRTSLDGEKSGAMGFTVSSAEARYESQGSNSSVRISIADMGAMSGAAAMATFAWATLDVDKDGDAGYERTTTIKGYRGYEKFDKQSNSGEIQAMVAGRFVVSVEGNEVPMDALKAAFDKVDVSKLEGMKNFGVK